MRTERIGLCFARISADGGVGPLLNARICVGAWLLTVSAISAAADDGVYPDRVVFGQSAALDGPARALGQNMRLGIRAAFEEANRSGGIAGRRLELISLNDSYEPAEAVINTRALIENHKVFALIGAVGTPPSRAVLPIVNEHQIPYIGPFTGAQFLREAKERFVFNVRASYHQETEMMVERLIADLNVSRIGVLYQDDSFGRAGLRGVVRALKKRELELLASCPYPRNSTIVKKAVLELRAAKPDAVIIVGSYAPAAEFIKWCRHLGFNPVFINISFVGSVALANSLGDWGEGVYVAQVVPFPFATGTPTKVDVVARYNEALLALHESARAGFGSLEGYLVGRLAIHIARRCEVELTRGCFLQEMRKPEPIDLDGFVLKFGEDDNQGSDSVFFTRLTADQQYFPVEVLRRQP